MSTAQHPQNTGTTAQDMGSEHGRAPERRYPQPRHPWTIVTRREVVAKLTDKAFLSGTILTLVMIVGLTVVSLLMGNRGTKADIAVVDDAGASIVATTDQREKQQNDKSEFRTVRVANEDEARQKVSAGDADAYLVRTDGVWRLVFHREPSSNVSGPIGTSVQAMGIADIGQKAGLTPQQVAQQTTLQTDLLDGSEDNSMLAQVAGFAFAILFFMSALTFGMQIAGSVVEEKASRIVEIISAAIPIRQLLAGKIIGSTLLAFAQMALFAIVGLVGISFTSMKHLLPAISGAVAWYLVYFVAGFLALACVWAVAGSLASRQEDLQSTTTPLTTGLTLVYMAGLFSSGTVQQVLSYFPVLSSVLMPARLVAGTVHWWELVLGLVINLAFAALTVLFGERIYRRALLQTGGAISYRQALKLAD